MPPERKSQQAVFHAHWVPLREEGIFRITLYPTGLTCHSRLPGFLMFIHWDLLMANVRKTYTNWMWQKETQQP